jgi:hypothetical protein
MRLDARVRLNRQSSRIEVALPVEVDLRTVFVDGDLSS